MHVLTFSLEACMLYASQLDRLISLKCHFCVVTVQALDYYVEKRSMCNDNQQQEQCKSFFGSWHSSECYFGTRADLFRGMTKHTLPQQKCCTTLAAASPSKLLQNY